MLPDDRALIQGGLESQLSSVGNSVYSVFNANTSTVSRGASTGAYLSASQCYVNAHDILPCLDVLLCLISDCAFLLLAGSA
jgi:hypothetical protein